MQHQAAIASPTASAPTVHTCQPWQQQQTARCEHVSVFLLRHQSLKCCSDESNAHLVVWERNYALSTTCMEAWSLHVAWHVVLLQATPGVAAGSQQYLRLQQLVAALCAERLVQDKEGLIYALRALSSTPELPASLASRFTECGHCRTTLKNSITCHVLVSGPFRMCPASKNTAAPLLVPVTCVAAWRASYCPSREPACRHAQSRVARAEQPCGTAGTQRAKLNSLQHSAAA